MKQHLLNYFKLSILFLGASVFLVTCQKEDDSSLKTNSKVEHRLITKTVSGSDIPEIMNFIKSKSNATLEFTLGNANFATPTSDPNENDLIITQVIIDEIETATLYDKTNYAFEMTTSSDDYFLNLVVKEWGNTTFMYFVKFVFDPNWTGTDLSTFTGNIYYYSDTGEFKMSTSSTNGTLDQNCPCGDGGGDCALVTQWICGFRNEAHNSISDCGCWVSDEGCRGFYPVSNFVCDGPQYGINPNINTTTNNCPCFPDDDSNDDEDPGSGGGSIPICPDAEPCTDELMSYDDNCNCVYNFNPITPINTEIDRDPCAKLNSLLDNNTFTNAISNIQLGTSGNSERGFEVSQDENGNVTTNFVQGSFDNTPLNHGNNIIGGIHNHTEDYGLPMFSGSDINKLYYYYIGNTNPNKIPADVFSILVSEQGTFAIGIKNLPMFGYILNVIGAEKLGEKLEGKYNKQGGWQGQSKYTGGLLKVLKKIKEVENMPRDAINLFRLSNDGTAFDQLILDVNNEPQATPCN